MLINAPPSSFTTVSAGDRRACGLHETGEITCWGRDADDQADLLPGSFTPATALSALAGRTSCAIHNDGAIECWGEDKSIYIPAR